MLDNIFLTKHFDYLEKEDRMAVRSDCLKVLSQIKDNSINLIFADPPYNIGKDFGNVKDKLAKDDYLSWCKLWIDECWRILAHDGTFYFMTATQNMSYLDVYVDEKYNVLSRIVWFYDSSGVQSKNYYGSLYEPIIMLVKNPKKYTFNASDILIEARTGAVRKLIDYRKDPPQPYNHKKVPGNVWEFPRVRYRMKEYENHPTQKPSALLERIILASSNPCDIVLDPFAGTFTTNEVAYQKGRKTIGIEINEDFYKIGLRRLKIIKEYNGEQLERDLSRKTNNLSKHVRDNEVNKCTEYKPPVQNILFNQI